MSDELDAGGKKVAIQSVTDQGKRRGDASGTTFVVGEDGIKTSIQSVSVTGQRRGELTAFAVEDLSGLLQWHLDSNETYDTTTYNSKQVLKNLASTGQDHSATVETPCLSGNGTSIYVDLGSSPLLPTGDWEVECWYYVPGGSVQGAIFAQWTTATGLILFHDGATNGWRLTYGGTTTNSGVIASAGWYHVRVVHETTTTTLYIDGVQRAQKTGSGDIPQVGNIALGYGNSATYNANIASFSSGRITDLKITNSTTGVVKTFPFQQGGTNEARDVYWCASDGTYGRIADAIKPDAASSTYWANRCTGYVKDWSIEYGGSIGPKGEYVPGGIGVSVDAEGYTKRYSSGKLSNPFSRINHNPNSVAALTTIGSESAGDYRSDRESEGTASTKFARISSSGKDRLFAVSTALTDGTLANAQIYASTVWDVRLAAFNIYAQGITAGSGTAYNAQLGTVNRYRPDVLGLAEVNNNGYLDQFGYEIGLPDHDENTSPPSGGSLYQVLYSRFTVVSSESVPSGSGGDEFARPPIYQEIDFGHPTVTLGVYMVHFETSGIPGVTAGDPVAREQNEDRRAVNWYRVHQHMIAKRTANANLVLAVMGDWNDDPDETQFATVTSSASDGSNLYGGFSRAASTPTSFSYALFPIRQATEGGLTIPNALNLAGNNHTLFHADPNAGVLKEVRIDYIAIDDEITIVGSELADSEVTQTGGIDKYGATLDSAVSRDASDHKMVVADIRVS